MDNASSRSVTSWLRTSFLDLRSAVVSGSPVRLAEVYRGVESEGPASVKFLLNILVACLKLQSLRQGESSAASLVSTIIRTLKPRSVVTAGFLSVADLLDILERVLELLRCIPAPAGEGEVRELLQGLVDETSGVEGVRVVLALLSTPAALLDVMIEAAPRDTVTSPTLMSPIGSPVAKRPREFPCADEADCPLPKPPKLEAIAAEAKVPWRPPAHAKVDSVVRPAVSSSHDIASLLWRPPLVSVCSPKYSLLLKPGSGSSPPPPGPLDPQHPQRVMDCTAEKLCKRMLKDNSSTYFFADLKYDGERLIGFKQKGVYSFFSRNMLAVPERKLDGVRALLDTALGPHDVCFDAEILSLHTFGSMNEVHKGEIGLGGPRIYLFDLLWINGHDITARPLHERKEILACATTCTKNVMLSKCFVIPKKASSEFSGESTEQLLTSVFDDAMAKRLEGYVLKPMSSTYRYNGTDWVKLKRGYMNGDTGTALPGGLVVAAAAAPKIRRIDGIPVTTALHEEQHKTHRLQCALTDTIDCIVVGYSGSTLLCAVRNEATKTFATVGFAQDPTRCVAPKPSRLMPFATNKPPDYVALSSSIVLDYVYLSLGDCPVVEVAAAGFVESATHTCERISFTPDAKVLRIREDKDHRCVNTSAQVSAMFAFAVPRPIFAPSDFIQDAVRRFNNMHWVALPLGPPCDVSVTVIKGSTACGAIEASLSVSSKPSTLDALLVAVAPQKKWSDKGVMREVSAKFGDEPSKLCNQQLASSSASSGDVCATLLSKHPTVVVFVAACVHITSLGPSLDDATVMGIVVVRIAGMLASLKDKPKEGCGKFAEVALHVDVLNASEEAVWTKAFREVLANVRPVSIRPTLRLYVR